MDQEARCSEKIKHSDTAVREFYESDEDCKRIDTIPGFGAFLSVLAKVEIRTIKRFKSASRLCSYAGVVPSTYSSGGKIRHGKIAKTGNRNLSLVPGGSCYSQLEGSRIHKSILFTHSKKEGE